MSKQLALAKILVGAGIVMECSGLLPLYKITSFLASVYLQMLGLITSDFVQGDAGRIEPEIFKLTIKIAKLGKR